jgi:hypothetical protein
MARTANGEIKACLIAVAKLWERRAKIAEQKNWEAEGRAKG